MNIIRSILLLGSMFVISNVNAGIIVGGTRVVYDGAKKESSLSVNNPDKIPYLIQTWIENNDGSSSKAPFIVTPPLFRLDGEQQNLLRIIRSGNLPEDQESLFWLNVKAIPAGKRAGNTLQIAVRTRIKLIYRPSSLKDNSPEDQADRLVWSRSGNQLKVKNPTAYYMNFNDISVDGKKLKNVAYVAPGATSYFPLSSGGSAVTWKIISDYGAIGPEHHTTF